MNPRTLTLAASLSVALSAACASRAPAPAAPPRAPPPPARLVVSIVLDQVGSWVLERHLPALRPEGAIKTLAGRGTWARNVVHTYAMTATGPGHAAIYTGAPPGESGVVANRRWDRARGRMMAILDDGEHVEHETGGRTFVSPRVLRVETVADALRRAAERRQGQTRIASLSMKDRGAVIPAGQRPDLALWYTEDARGFTTSAYYAPELPAWVRRWNAAHPLTARFEQPWVPLDEALLRERAGRDDEPGEGDWHGLGTTFPHRLTTTDDPYIALLATPHSTDHLLDMARAAVQELHMGEDDAPDLLMISVSGTDYVGHVFGPESWEALDNLVRVDLALGRFLRELEARATVAVLVTADHGVMPLVEHSRAQGNAGAARIQFDAVAGAAERACDEALGAGDWVAGYVLPYVYLKEAALRPEVRERAVQAAAEAVRRVPGVGAVHRTEEAARWRDDPDPVRRSIASAIDVSSAGELFVVPADGSPIDERMPQGFGTSHGSPWPRDTHVPLLVAGPGVAHAELPQDVEFTRIAATLAALLGVGNPSHLRADPLPGISPLTLRPRR